MGSNESHEAPEEQSDQHVVHLEPRQSSSLPRAPPQRRISNPPALGTQSTRVLENPLNLRKGTLQAYRDPRRAAVRVKFVVDAKCDFEVNVQWLAQEVRDGGMPRIEATTVPPAKRQYRAGMGLEIDRAEFSIPVEDAPFGMAPKKDENCFPLVIQLVSLTGDVEKAQISYVKLRGMAGDSQAWKAEVVQQKMRMGDNVWVMHEIFGLEGSAPEGEQELLGGRDCVICLSEPRDTAVLPCSHMCLCNGCANVMRIQSNKCPICRQPATSLLQLTASASSPE